MKKNPLTNQTCSDILREMEADTVMDALLRFQNGAVMVTPIDRVKPVPETFRMPTPEGATFVFSLIDVLPSGRLVYKEQISEECIESSK